MVGNVGIYQQEDFLVQKNICFSSVSKALLLVDDRDAVCYNFVAYVCNGKILKDCPGSQADFSKAPKIYVKIRDTEFVFDSSSYLYINNEGFVDCYFGDIKAAKEAQECSSDSEIGVGRMFLSKYMPILTFKPNKTTSLTFLSAYNPKPPVPPTPYISSKGWLVLFVILVAGGAGYYSYNKRRR